MMKHAAVLGVLLLTTGVGAFNPFSSFLNNAAQAGSQGMATGLAGAMQAQQGLMANSTNLLAQGVQAQQGAMMQGTQMLAQGVQAQQGAMMQGTQMLAQGMQAQQGLMQQGAQAALAGMVVKQNAMNQALQAKENMSNQLNATAINREQAFVAQQEKTDAAKMALLKFLEEALVAGGDDLAPLFEYDEPVEHTAVDLVQRCAKFKALRDAFVAERSALMVVLDTHIGLPPGFAEQPLRASVVDKPLAALVPDASSIGESFVEQFQGDEQTGYIGLLTLASGALKMVEQEEESSESGGWQSMLMSAGKAYAKNNLRVMPVQEYSVLREQVRQAEHELLTFCTKVICGGAYAVLAKRQQKAWGDLVAFIDKAFAEDYSSPDDLEEEASVVVVPEKPRARYASYASYKVAFKTADMSYWALCNTAFGRMWPEKLPGGSEEEAAADERVRYESARDQVAVQMPGIKESLAPTIAVYPIAHGVADSYDEKRNAVSVLIQKVLAIADTKLKQEADAAPLEEEPVKDSGDVDEVGDDSVADFSADSDGQGADGIDASAEDDDTAYDADDDGDDISLDDFGFDDSW